MGSAEAKAGQAYRREARSQLRHYRSALNERLRLFNNCLRPRPKWVHKKVWQWVGSFFIDIEKLEKGLAGMPEVPE